MGRQDVGSTMGLYAIRIIHRDIKPSNILWDDSRRRQATLVDFGRPTEDSLEKLSPSDGRKFSEFSEGSRTVVTSDGIVGTDGYQAGSRYTTKIDVFSLGVTLSSLARDAGIDSCEALTEAVALQHSFFALH
jgi:serine/threonine protein kinase